MGRAEEAPAGTVVATVFVSTRAGCDNSRRGLQCSDLRGLDGAGRYALVARGREKGSRAVKQDPGEAGAQE